MSKNRPTIDHLRLACRHVDELIDAGVTENHAIRTLELFADVYAKTHSGGTASPNSVSQVSLWSIAALKVKRNNSSAKPKLHFVVEHGTPKRAFARLVMKLHHENRLTKQAMDVLVRRHWKLAVVTLDEDTRLNRIAKSKMYATPEERWTAAGIKFPRGAKSKPQQKMK